jgi:hypothetical protein
VKLTIELTADQVATVENLIASTEYVRFDEATRRNQVIRSYADVEDWVRRTLADALRNLMPMHGAGAIEVHRNAKAAAERAILEAAIPGVGLMKE